MHRAGTLPHWRNQLAALGVTLVGFLARLWNANGTFLNPDEALHFRLANQSSFSLAYKESLTASHPPLLTVILYFWRLLGTSEVWLRLPLVLAGVAFCWMFYKWLSNTAGEVAGFVGLIFLAFLPPIVSLSSEIRQYALVLAFLASALYLLDAGFANRSNLHMAGFALCLYVAMLSHYSALLFAAALGMYTLLRIFTERPPAALISTWFVGQLGASALAVVLYRTHIAKLGVGESRTVLQGWMSEFFLRRSYFDPTHDNPLLFLLGHSFGVFQFVFGQLVVGDLMGICFLLGVAMLLRGEHVSKGNPSSRMLGVFLLLPFLVAAAASLLHVYPYGGTRHISFLIIPGVAGISVAVVRLAKGRWALSLAITVVILLACIAFGRPRRPTMDRADQASAHIAAAIGFVKANVDSSDLIFTDYQTDLILGHYLCRHRPIDLDAAPAGFEQFACGEHRVVSTDYKTEHMLWTDFPQHWQAFIEAYNLKAGASVWVIQAGWEADLPEQLRNHIADFHDLRFESFGRNIKIFKLKVRPLSRSACLCKGEVRFKSLDEHAISIGIKPVALSDRVFIGVKNLLPSRKGAYQHKQRRFRQVKVGEYCVDQLKCKAWVDKNIRSGGACHDAACTNSDGVFESAHRGGADRNHPAALPQGEIDGRGRSGRNQIGLDVNLVIFDALHPYGLKRSQANVERDVDRLNSLAFYAAQDLRSEVKPGGGSRNRTTVLGIDRLIAFAIPGRVWPRDVRRKRDVADAIKNCEEIRDRVEANAALAEFPPGDDLSL
jgi:hypothetical protein